MRGRSRRPGVAVLPGERVLAWTALDDGRTMAGTREALYLPDGTRVPWESVEAARWERDSATFVVSEVGTWGAQRPVHRLALTDPGRFLELVRERVSATVVLQRHVAITGRRGVRVIARRDPSGDRAVTWVYEYDEGVDPDDPAVRAAAREALAVAREQVGL